MINNIQKKGMKNKTTTTKKKRQIIFQSYNDIKQDMEKEDKENIHINLLNALSNSVKISCENHLFLFQIKLTLEMNLNLQN